MNHKQTTLILLGLSLLFFLRKGIQYALFDSYIPWDLPCYSLYSWPSASVVALASFI